MTNRKQLYVEKREQEGDFVVKWGKAKRASAIEPTQEKAIERAREINPGHSPLVERVRKTNRGGRDQWRKP